MPRLSKLLEKLEDRIANKWGRWYERNKARVPLYAVLGALGWYFYGMLLNSLKLGRESVFNTTRDEQNRQKELPANRQMGIKRASGVSRAQKP